MMLNADARDVEHLDTLLIATIVPRASGWVRTRSTPGVAHLAPCSCLTVVGRQPPVGSRSMPHRSDGVTRQDSCVHLREPGACVTQLVTRPLVAARHQTAFESPPAVDACEAVGLEKAPSVVVRPPRVALAPVAMACTLDRCFTVGADADHVVWGRVVGCHLHDEVDGDEGRVDTAAFAPVGRLAAAYARVDHVCTTPRDAPSLAARQGRRMPRLDRHPTDVSAVGWQGWSQSGSVLAED